MARHFSKTQTTTILPQAPAVHQAAGIFGATGQEYWYSDPAFPDLKGLEPIRDKPMNFNVMGFAGGGFDLGSVQAQAAGCHIGLCNSLSYMRQRTKTPLNGWAATGQLQVQPRAGMDFNAFYDRSGLRFFYKQDPSTGHTVYTCEASPVVVHELGHAILDAIRPDFWSTQALEIHAFHEAFGDCNAIIHLTMYDPFVQYVLQVTGGNLRQSNPMSQLAVQMATAIYHTRRPLRDAWNTFTYVQPETLPKNGPEDQLCQEPHNFSRVWSGTFYDLIVSIYEKLQTLGTDQFTALRQATDVAARYLLYGIAISANTPRYYDSIAHSMLAADQAAGLPYQDLMISVFTQRKVLQERLMAMNDVKPQDVSGQKVVNSGGVLVVKESKLEVLKLSESVELLALDENPLYSVAIEVAADSYYHFTDGYLVDKIEPDRGDILDAALSSVQYIHEEDLVGDGKPWQIVDGKLVRQHYNYDAAYTNNSLVKGSPEYGKPWKPQNNSGCCGNKPKPQPTKTVVKVGCYVRATACQGNRAKSCQVVKQRGC